MAREYPLTFYNLDNNRPNDEMSREVEALLEARPAILAVCEANGYSLPDDPDYRLIRNTSKPGRANLAAYVKQNLEVSDIKWFDCEETWTKTNPGATGQHWPRSILEFRAGRLKVWVAHQPPKGTDNTHNAQLEGIDKLEARMAPWCREDWDDKTDKEKAQAKDQARVILWDANRRHDEDGPGPKTLCNRIDGYHSGEKIDLACHRGNEVKQGKDARYFDSAGDVQLCSDHGHAFTFTLVCYDP